MCSDGKQCASKWILQHSKFFSEKIQACERHGNKLEFDYTGFTTKTIRAYLDLLHGIQLTDIEMTTILSLLRFLRFEGKASLDGKGKPISELEHDLYKAVHLKLEQTELLLEDKVLAGLVLSEVDSYDGTFFEVLQKVLSSLYLKVFFRLY